MKTKHVLVCFLLLMSVGIVFVVNASDTPQRFSQYKENMANSQNNQKRPFQPELLQQTKPFQPELLLEKKKPEPVPTTKTHSLNATGGYTLLEKKKPEPVPTTKTHSLNATGGYTLLEKKKPEPVLQVKKYPDVVQVIPQQGA